MPHMKYSSPSCWRFVPTFVMWFRLPIDLYCHRCILSYDTTLYCILSMSPDVLEDAPHEIFISILLTFRSYIRHVVSTADWSVLSPLHFIIRYYIVLYLVNVAGRFRRCPTWNIHLHLVDVEFRSDIRHLMLCLAWCAYIFLLYSSSHPNPQL